MPTYEKVPADVTAMAARMITKFHQELEEFEVKIDLLFAYATTDSNGDTTGVALKKNGRQVLGLAKVVSLKERCKGAGDAEILLDGDEWENLGEEEQLALLDHELEHFVIRRDKDGGVKRDDLERPKLKCIPHDREVGWFDAVVRRHQYAAPEWKTFDAICKATSQLSLPFEAVG